MAYWIEKSLFRSNREHGPTAVGRALISPVLSQAGADIYRFMRDVKPGDIILHLTDNEAFSKISIVSMPAHTMLRGTEDWYFVALEASADLSPTLPREVFFGPEFGPRLRALVENGTKYVFYTRDLKLQQGKYLTPAAPPLLHVLDDAYFVHSGKRFADVLPTLSSRSK